MEYIILGFSLIIFGFTAIIDQLFLVIYYSRRVYEHELGHANAAKAIPLPVFILMKNGKKSGIQNEIPCYKVTKKDFESNYNSKRAAAVTIYDNYDSLSCDQRKKIIEAGPMSEKRWLLNWKRQLPILCFLLPLSLIFIVTFTQYINLWVEIILTLVISVLTHLGCMWFQLARSKGMFPKRSIDKFKRMLEKSPKGSKLKGGICDSAKLKYWDTYIECLEIIKNKKLKPMKSYKEILDDLKSKGYVIYSSEEVQEDGIDDNKSISHNKDHNVSRGNNMWDTETEYKVPPIETVTHPWLRFFARTLDLNLTTILWKAFSALLLHYNSNNVFLGSLYDSYIAFFLLLMLEPLLLSTWGTTPGKKLFGLVIRDTSGNKLTFKKALVRTWGVFGAGCGYNIPIYSLVRLYQSYKKCSSAEPLSWEEDTSYNIKNTKYYRRVIYAGMFLLLLGIAYIIGLQAVMPIHRGELTAAQYAENCNNYMSYIGYGTFMKLDDTGNWIDKNPNLLTYSELPPHRIIVKDGKVNGIEIEVEIKDGDLVSSYQNQQWIAVMGFVAAQREMNCFRMNTSKLIKAVQKSFENYTDYEAGIRVKNEIEYTGYSMSDNFLIPTGENPYFHMRFTLEKVD